MMEHLSPIVFFVYNRPAHTRLALESLALNELAARSNLFVYCDAPPTGSSRENCDAVEQTRRIVRERQWCGHVEVIEAATNLGCDGSMLSGINEVISAHGQIIVLEDDLVVGPYWLSFLNDGLKLYKYDDRVGAISGYMYPVVHRELPPTFFSCFLNFWGWGTWLTSWSEYQPDASVLLSELKRKRLIERFMLGRPEYLQYLKDLRGKRDSYDILWYATLLTQEKVVLYPGQSLVRNNGFDLSGTHLSILDGPNPAFLEQKVAEHRQAIEPLVIDEDNMATMAVIEANSYIWPSARIQT